MEPLFQMLNSADYIITSHTLKIKDKANLNQSPDSKLLFKSTMRPAPSNSATWYWAAHSTSNVTFIRLCCSSGGIEAGSSFLDKHRELHLERAALQLEIHMLAVFLESLRFCLSPLTLLVICLVFYNSNLTKIWLFISCVAQPLLPPTPCKKVFHLRTISSPCWGRKHIFRIPCFFWTWCWNVHNVCRTQVLKRAE